jgi:2-keto-4-pentenoate hydratase/2-oxohepta-3-ene-1,7-dioic acid hydratase in catechol pathway
MKLIRFGEPGAEKPGVIINEKRYDVSEYISEYDEQFFGSNGIERLAKWVSDNHNNLKPVDDSIRLGAPLARPSKVICIGLNYVDHAKETGATAPQEPILFFKSSSAVVGPNDDLVIPKGSEKTDWEVELAVIIGKKASYVAEEDANAYIAGYCLHNDYSERTFQLERGGQWVKGKSCDTFAPLGPFIALRKDIENIDNLRLWLTVNGKMMQDGNTSNLIFKIPFLVHYISQFMTLLPGDVISTGTPHGVAMGMKPQPVYLKPGDVVELGIDGMGTSRQVAKAYE